MKPFNKISVIVCDLHGGSLFEFKQIFKELKIEQVEYVTREESVIKKCNEHMVDIVLFNVAENARGEFQLGNDVAKLFPDTFLVFYSSANEALNPLTAIATNGVGYIQRRGQKDLLKKISFWVEIAMNVRTVRNYLNENTRSPRRIFA